MVLRREVLQLLCGQAAIGRGTGPLQADWESQHTLLGKEKGRWSQKKITRLRTGRVEGRMNVVKHRDQAAALTASISFHPISLFIVILCGTRY